jgi:hypothetical protein
MDSVGIAPTKTDFDWDSVEILSSLVYKSNTRHTFLGREFERRQALGSDVKACVWPLVTMGRDLSRVSIGKGALI